MIEKIKKTKRARIGLYTMGLRHYWGQFKGLKERITSYGEFIKSEIEKMDADVFYYGLVDCEKEGRACGEFFNANNVDLIFAHIGTYVDSGSILPTHLVCKAKTVVLNLQPSAKINYKKSTTGEWLAFCGACPAPEIANAFNRAGIEFNIVNGLLGLDYTPEISLTNENTKERSEAKRAWREILEWVSAARVKSGLSYSRFGFLGNNYSGMLDLYTDFTAFEAETGAHVEILEMCDLKKNLELVTREEIAEKKKEIMSFFDASVDNSADPMAKKPTEEQIEWSSKVACALERMAREFDLDGLSYYYHGYDGGEYEELQSGLIVGNSLLTAKGIPCAGEGDLKTCLAMKICDILGVGGSYCEIVVTDYEDGTILLGHDGPFHIEIANGKPILRGLGVYHGKKGSGVSVEAKVKTGPVTNLNCTSTINGRLKFIIAEGESTGGEIMTIGNTQTPVKFPCDPDSFMDKWFMEYPTHHFAMSVGNNASVFEKVSKLLNIDFVTISRR